MAHSRTAAARSWRRVLLRRLASRWARTPAKVYKWTDKNGVTHYGDSAPDTANPR